MNFSELADGQTPIALDGLANDGHFIDIYSDYWLSINSTQELNFPSAEHLREAFGKECFHHLRILIVGDDLGAQGSLLQTVPELGWQFAGNVHVPDIIFFHVREALILSVGLGRKNRIFAFDANRDSTVKVNFLEPQASCTDPFMQRFVRLDHCGLDPLRCAREAGGRLLLRPTQGRHRKSPDHPHLLPVDRYEGAEHT